MRCSTCRGATFGRLECQRPPLLARSTRISIAVRAQTEEESTSRRLALAFVASGGVLLAASGSSQAAYGDAANIFGRTTNTSEFVPYAGEGFAIQLPSKWGPSKELDFAGIQLRYEDNFDPLSHVAVIKKPTDKKSMEEFGTPEQFLKDQRYLFGKQVFSGETISEGGFAPGRVSAASILESGSSKDSKGKTYYNYAVLTRSADNTEGGRHNLISAAVGNGNLYLMRVQIGDKRWFKGADKYGRGVYDSFTVA